MSESALVQPSGDRRLAALLAWVRRTGRCVSDWRVASADASFRRYFRLWVGDQTVIAMDAPPEKEGTAAFIRVSGLLREAGVNAPRVLAADCQRGYLLLDDLGSRTYLDGLEANEANALFEVAIDTLVRWQAATCRERLPDYTDAMLRRELRLFPEWYLGQHMGWDPTDRAGRDWEGLEERLVEAALEQPQVYVHRDYMPRNLMRAEPCPGVIDFQDAVIGPVTYDIVSLLRDAFVDWSPAFEEECFAYYWHQARGAGVPVPAAFERFRRDLDLMGAQRHLKVLGIFARLCYRDGKPKYLTEAPRFVRYLRREVNGEPALAPLSSMLDRLARTA